MSTADPLKSVFTDDVLQRLASRKHPTDALLRRLRVLNASGPYPADPFRARNVYVWRQQRAAWDAYITAAQALGLLDEDLRQRLTGADDDGFRAAIAECMGIWVVAGMMGLSVRPRPAGRNKAVLEFAIDDEAVLGSDGSINVEVKAPYREPLRPGGAAFGNGDSAALAQTIDAASKQFDRGRRNLLLIVPSLSTPMVLRRSIVKAFLGQETIQILIDRRTGLPVGDPKIRFAPGGKLARLHGEALKPRFTRVSAVLVVEKILQADYRLDHQITIVHNPYAERPIPPELFAGYPQLIRGEGEELVWTDTGGKTVDG